MALAEDLARPTAAPRTPKSRRPRWVGGAAVFAWFVAMAIYVSWPLSIHLTDRVVGDLADPLETAWMFGWGAHGIVHQPLQIFEGNMFHPLHHTLAFSENMLGLSVPSAPIFWLTNNAVLQLNLVMLGMLVVSGLGMFLLVRTVTDDWRVALVAGTAYEVLPYRLSQFSHLHVAGHLLPWALLLLVLLHRRASPRLNVALGLLIGLQWWTSLTGGAVMVAACGAWAAWLLVAERRAAAPALVRTAAGVALGMLLAAPVFVPYLAVRNNHPEFAHPQDEVTAFSATPQSYLVPPGGRGPVVDKPYDYLREHFHDAKGAWEKTLWPGFAVAIGFPLAFAAAVVPRRKRPSGRHGPSVDPESSAWRRPFTAFALVAATGAVLSLGPHAGARPDGAPLPFLIFTRIVPGGLMRVPARFGMLTAAGLIAAAAVGLARLPARWRSRAVVVAMVMIILEAMPQILTFATPPPLTAAHRRLADRPGAILALPTAEYGPGDLFKQETIGWDPQHMYLSTGNFRPLVNGYGAFLPGVYLEMVKAVQDVPSPEAFAMLRQRGVRTIVVQTEMIKTTKWAGVVARLKAYPGVRRIDGGRGVEIFDISVAVAAP